jgi:hypothetical protein
LDEDIVHALSNERINMNKVSLAEAGDGSPPFWRNCSDVKILFLER